MGDRGGRPQHAAAGRVPAVAAPTPHGDDPMNAIDEIRKLYFSATRETIAEDFDRAIDLLKSVETVDERQRATVYMHGLAEMKAGWIKKPGKPQTKRK